MTIRPVVIIGVAALFLAVTAIYMLTVGAVPVSLRTVVAVMLQQLLGINVSDIPPGGANYCLAAPLVAGRSVYACGQRFVV